MPMVGMQRIPNVGIAPFNIVSQASMGVNPDNIPMQRGVAAQTNQQQLRRKDPGMGMQNPDSSQQTRCFRSWRLIVNALKVGFSVSIRNCLLNESMIIPAASSGLLQTPVAIHQLQDAIRGNLANVGDAPSLSLIN